MPATLTNDRFEMEMSVAGYEFPDVTDDVVRRLELDDPIEHVDGGAPANREDRLDDVLELQPVGIAGIENAAEDRPRDAGAEVEELPPD